MKHKGKRVLFIGGTGNISSACTRLAIAENVELFHLNRGNSQDNIDGVRLIKADIHDFESVKLAIRPYNFDVVVNFVAFTAEDVHRDFELFKDKTKQYIFISSASAYQKPLLFPIVTESTPLSNPYWEYSRNKIEAELKLNQLFRDFSFPITIVRPSLTYETVIPVPIGGWKEYTVIKRIKEGRPVIVHGDGTSLWTITHSSDFARGLIGLFSHQQALGHAFHITSDEILTWDQIYQALGDAVGCDVNMVHVSSESICAIAEESGRESMRGSLIGDKAVSVIFDNSKIKRFVPEFKAEIPFKAGIKDTILWFEANPERCFVNPGSNAFMDRLAEYARK